MYTPEYYLLTIDTVASLAAYISEMIYNDSLSLKYGDELILAFFTFNCNIKMIQSEYLSEDTLWETNTSWQDAVYMLSSTMDNSSIKLLTMKFADIIEKSFLEINDRNYTHLADMIINYTRSVQKSKPLLVSELLVLFFDRPFVLQWQEKLKNLAINNEYIKGNLSSPFNSFCTKEIGDVNEDDVIKYFMWIHLKIIVISTSIEETTEEFFEEESEDATFIQILDNPERWVLNTVYDICVFNVLENNYKNVRLLFVLLIFLF